MASVQLLLPQQQREEETAFLNKLPPSPSSSSPGRNGSTNRRRKPHKRRRTLPNVASFVQDLLKRSLLSSPSFGEEQTMQQENEANALDPEDARLFSLLFSASPERLTRTKSLCDPPSSSEDKKGAAKHHHLIVPPLRQSPASFAAFERPKATALDAKNSKSATLPCSTVGGFLPRAFSLFSKSSSSSSSSAQQQHQQEAVPETKWLKERYNEMREQMLWMAAEQRRRCASSPAITVATSKAERRRRYSVQEEIGKGAFAVVHKAVDHRTGKHVAIKTLLKPDDKNARNALLVEARGLSKLSHPNIIRLLSFTLQEKNEKKERKEKKKERKAGEREDAEEDDVNNGASNKKKKTKKKNKKEKKMRQPEERGPEELVLEFVEGRDLFQLMYHSPSPTPEHISDNDYIRTFSEEEAKTVFRQLLSAVQCCHNNGIAHRDLKPENLILDERLNLKLIDFGLCLPFDRRRPVRQAIGTLLYAAPEVVTNRYYLGPEVDIWAMGVILFEMLYGFLPFDGWEDENPRRLCRAIARCEFYFPSSPSLSYEVKDLISGILQPMELRYSLREIKRHPWLASCASAIVDGDVMGMVEEEDANLCHHAAHAHLHSVLMMEGEGVTTAGPPSIF
ncbi:ATP-dependent RNA helicase DBP3 [Balamuthia mandrillaris]